MNDPSAAGGRLTIDLAALADNWRAMAKHAGSAVTAAAVKGDAYGLGIEPVVTTRAPRAAARRSRSALSRR